MKIPHDLCKPNDQNRTVEIDPKQITGYRDLDNGCCEVTLVDGVRHELRGKCDDVKWYFKQKQTKPTIEALNKIFQKKK